jgi:isopenicillin N synthase-like dioxygenase
VLGKASSFSELPVVDVSPLMGGGDAAPTIAALSRAAREVGFLYVIGHGVPQRLIRGIEATAAALFALPEAIKLRYHIQHSHNHRGYVPPGEEMFYSQTRDTKEAFDLSRELPAADYGPASRFLGPNVWPLELAPMKALVLEYYEAVFALGRRLLSGFAQALGLAPDHFEPQLTRPPSQLRLIHYPPAPAAGDGMGIGAHTDYECLTVLHATAPGLQVMNGQGQWIAAPPVPGAFVINIADLLEVLSNGLFVSTSHRVVPVSVERYSFPLFFNLDFETRVQPLPHLASAGARYPALIAGEHLLAQTMQSFRYLRALWDEGQLQLPPGARELSSFGRERQ